MFSSETKSLWADVACQEKGQTSSNPLISLHVLTRTMNRKARALGRVWRLKVGVADLQYWGGHGLPCSYAYVNEVKAKRISANVWTFSDAFLVTLVFRLLAAFFVVLGEEEVPSYPRTVSSC